jgi:hypothetical protein
LVECGIAFGMARGFQRTPKATGEAGGCLTRPSHAVRVRLNGVPIWRLPGPTCTAVCTVLPHGVWRERCRSPEGARHGRIATHGGLSWAWGAVIWHVAPLALEHLVGAFGHQHLVAVLTRCGRALPVYGLAAEQHSRGRTEQVSLPTIGRGRGRWPLGSIADARAADFTPSYPEVQRAAFQQEPSARVPGIRRDGFESTSQRRRTRFPGARLGHGLRQARPKLPSKLTAIASPVRQAWRSPFHTLLDRARQRQGLRGLALGHRWRRFADHVATTAGAANGARVRPWSRATKAGR